ncbi:MAG: mercury resistance system periplasmic binding protein MerP [Betaproteobacteria bacterium]|nr:MAG: mercury resistance system periplasmic binding protein MerP [Betaproteobacteria bacterium]
MSHEKTVLRWASVLSLLTAPTWASIQTVMLSVSSMNCPVCPITVKKALNKVPGVSKTNMNFEKRQAIVTFDDAKTSVDALTRATRDAGYPSVLAGSRNE